LEALSLLSGVLAEDATWPHPTSVVKAVAMNLGVKRRGTRVYPQAFR